jgi:hypothetical protein
MIVSQGRLMNSKVFRVWGIVTMSGGAVVSFFQVAGYALPVDVGTGSLWMQALVAFGLAEVLERLGKNAN